MKPEMEYLGYTYEVEYDDDPDDCTRKFWHIVRDSSGQEVKGEKYYFFPKSLIFHALKQ